MKEIKNKTNAMKLVEKAHGGEKPLEEILRVLYVEEGLNIHQIGKELGISPSTAYRWLKEADITMRKMTWI